MKKKAKNYLLVYVMAVLMVLLMLGVVLYAVFRNMDKANGKDSKKDSESIEDAITSEFENQYLILRNDTVLQELYVYSYENCEEYRYRYNLYTEFLDRYDNHASLSHFTTGRVVCLEMDKAKRELSKIKISDKVWEMTDITRYTVDERLQTLTIGNDKYSLRDTVYFSDENRIGPEEIKEKDELMLIGKDKKILSVVVTTGQGILALVNTSKEVDFDGGYIQIGTKYFSRIRGEMELEVKEGTYTVSVTSPDGYGDSTELTITRGTTLTLDLATLQGEGPKKGQITFVIDEESAVLKVDNVEVSLEEPLSLKYGLHTFLITAEGYEPYSRYLFVNSEKAKVTILLSQVGTKTESSSEQNTESQQETEKESEKETETESEEEQKSETPTVPTTSELIDAIKDALKE